MHVDDTSVLWKLISSDEIRNTMFGIGGDKAPGHDGYITQFFKKTWTIVREDVV